MQIRTSRKELDQAEELANAFGVAAKVRYRAAGGCDVTIDGATEFYRTLTEALYALVEATDRAALA